MPDNGALIPAYYLWPYALPSASKGAEVKNPVLLLVLAIGCRTLSQLDIQGHQLSGTPADQL
jgi:hypothetical protein